MVVGKSLPAAFLSMYMLESACKIQIDALAGNTNLNYISHNIISNTPLSVNKVSLGLGPDIVWPALIRKLDKIDTSYKQ